MSYTYTLASWYGSACPFSAVNVLNMRSPMSLLSESKAKAKHTFMRWDDCDTHKQTHTHAHTHIDIMLTSFSVEENA